VTSDGSITFWIGAAKSGDDAAAEKIWQRYSPRLAQLARKRLPRSLRGEVDGEHVASSALGALISGIREGRFPEVGDREDLWALLACMTVRRAINEIKRAMRQKRRPPGQRVPLDQALVASDPPPDLKLIAAEQFDRLLSALARKDEILKKIALWKFEGYTNEQIAGRLGCSCQKVTRKLNLIRMAMEAERPR
jgi:RNA polymerase sigma factor (sigma-70 family)